MFAVFAPPSSQPTSASKSGAATVASLLAAVACSAGALAADLKTPMLTAGKDVRQAQFEVSGSSLPHFDLSDNATQSNRIDLALMPPGRAGLGLAMSVTSLTGSRWNSLAPARMPGTPAIDFGLQWRYTLDSNYRIDVTAWRRMVTPDAITVTEAIREPSYGARVEMRISTTTSRGFTADKGFLGFQLDSGARISVKRKNGGPMFYYRNAF